MASAAHPSAHRLIRILIVGTGVLIAALAAMITTIALNLRDEALINAEASLKRHSMTLAAQAERSLQSIDLILSSIADHLDSQNVVDSASYAAAMGGWDAHAFLKAKLVGLPQLEAIAMVDAHGQLINSSRSWPAADVNVSDRDYFQALRGNPKLQSYIGAPVQNRETGTWDIYIARRVATPAGSFSGLVLAAVSLQYFQEFYRSISLGEGSAISLFRDDGYLLARYPRTASVGRAFPANDLQVLLKSSALSHERSPVDQMIRITAAQRLAGQPLLILASQTEDSVLVGWRRTVQLLAAFGAGMVLLLVIATFVVVRKWRQQDLLAEVRAGKAEAEKAKALAEAELLRQQERTADAASRAKSNFLAMMSHEIRTPMNAVLGLASSLLDTSLDADQRKSIKAIHDSGDNLLEILNDILDFSKLESGVFSMESVPFAAIDVVESVTEIVGERARSKGLQLRIEVGSALPPVLSGDAGRIRQVLLNLLYNAIKFTAQGEVVVRVEALRTADDHATVRWSVIDTGVGIPPERLGALFQDFVQVDSSISRRFGGSGLGLAICRRIVEQMGGEIGVDSRVGAGSTFRFDLTLQLSDQRPAQIHDDRSTPALLAARIRALGHPLRILITDDNSTNRMVASKMFTGFDVKITEAADGVEAIEAVDREDYDLILMDMQMPEIDGLTATVAIRARGGRYASVPIVAFTANAFSDDREACARAGMTDFVAKPVRKSLLLQAALRALGSTPAVAAGASGTAAEPPAGDNGTPCARAESAADVFDRTFFDSLAGELDLDDALVTYDVFLQDAVDRLTALSTASVDADRPGVRVNAHSLKSTAAQFGFSELARLALQLETSSGDIGEQDFDLMVAGLRTAFEAGKARFDATYRSAA
ncbi:MAG: ATP-binding protein [Xanthobacteraceae bacterium]|nr:ATP-binding protein [Xanthobacteraceae bacterium]